MKKIVISIIFPMAIVLQVTFVQAQTDDEKRLCKYSAEYMIDIAKQSLKEKSSRPERIEKRRQSVEEWISRMEGGEDPCAVYADIQKEATTY